MSNHCELRDAYQIMQDSCGINVGDKVKVLRKAKDYEMGWPLLWIESMDRYVGYEYIVNYFENDGVRLISCIHPKIYNDRYGERHPCIFPFFVLELIESKPEIKKVTMVEVCEKFGCDVEIVSGIRADKVSGDISGWAFPMAREGGNGWNL